MNSDAAVALRGVSVGALSALTTVTAHHLGGAAVPSEAAGLLLLLVCSSVGYVATTLRAQRFTRTALMGCLAAAQALGHLALTVAGPHRHGPLLDERMAGAHLLAVIAGACLVYGAERGLRWAVSTLRWVLPGAVILVAGPDTTVAPRPAYRRSLSERLLDLSGTGTRGPPVPL
ncbi:hypothetical protein [Nocardia sp. X0981]